MAGKAVAQYSITLHYQCDKRMVDESMNSLRADTNFSGFVYH